ncbi:hypothetical protein EVAR_83658_1 [Eumeta japonica]|uniref:Uncharacterized protein n=1 Tax=Eumeta variegata TaxID=151549 RepID=A0A4C1UPP3_EUMVA|nr:hypothetical protein EVAR_83658_1 [Eumeta japonica]
MKSSNRMTNERSDRTSAATQAGCVSHPIKNARRGISHLSDRIGRTRVRWREKGAVRSTAGGDCCSDAGADTLSHK